MRVTLKLRERETGLRSIGAGPRGWDIRVDGKHVGSVSALGGGMHGPVRGWYFAANEPKLGIPYRNTCGEIGVPVEDVKKAAVAYVKQCLAARAAEPGSEAK